MKIIQKIREFFAKHFSKHVWRERWLDICASPRKSVKAETLEDLCGYINPPYSRIVELVKEAGGNTFPLTDGQGMVNLFYTDRDAFLTHLKDGFGWPYFSAEAAASLHEKLKEVCFPTTEEFHKRVKDKGLEGHIAVRRSFLNSDAHIDFNGIQVEGKINLSFGGKFDSCKFNHVEFCNDATITIFPTDEIHCGEVGFTKNICCGNFSCFFPSIHHIHIGKNIFRYSVKLMVAARLTQNTPVSEWIKSRMHGQHANSSNIEFSDNHVRGVLAFYDDFDGTVRDNIKMISFKDGNIIGGLSVPPLRSYEDEKTVACDDILQEHSPNIRIGDIHFDMNERIVPSLTSQALNYKQYFISLKNRAIEMRDREAEFKYGRQERYFDWYLADRWQDKFILRWSQLVSDNGISWIRPIGWLIAVQAILAAAFIGWNVWICAFDWSVGGWAKTVIESFDPLKNVESACPDSLSAPFYNVARKIFLFLFLYEIIKVFRRFSK